MLLKKIILIHSNQRMRRVETVGEKSLLDAAEKKDFGTLAELLQKGVNPNVCNGVWSERAMSFDSHSFLFRVWYAQIFQAHCLGEESKEGRDLNAFH